MYAGPFCSRIRRGERLFLNKLRNRSHEMTKIGARKKQFDLMKSSESFDGLGVVVDCCLATSRSIYITRFLKSYGVPVTSSHETADICVDKTRNSLALMDTGVPTPNMKVAFAVDSAMDIVRELGYPRVPKPVVGSWGCLMVEIGSESAVEAVLEHRPMLGNYKHKMFYIQEFAEKLGRGIRMLATNDELVAVTIRSSDYWLTNAAEDASVGGFEFDDRAKELVKQASNTVGGDLPGTDPVETGDDYTVYEVNHTVEFKTLNDVVKADIPVTIVN